MTGIVAREFFGYFWVSFIALSVDAAFFLFALRIVGWGWLLSSVFGFFLGVSVAYFLSIKIVFKTRKYLNAPRLEAFVFFATGLVGVLVTIFVLGVCIDVMSWQPELSKIISAGFTFVSNFAVRKFFLFKS